MMTQLFFDQSEKPLSGPQDVQWLLAEPRKQWVPKYSAYETACSWFDANGLPIAIKNVLRTDAALANAKLRKAYFEKQTQVDDSGRRPSQTDVLAFLEIDSGIGVLGIEGKVNESFGLIISEWNDYSPGKLRRLAGLVERLRLKRSVSLGSLRYQLLHRTVATLIEAQRAKVREAAMIVQSFSPDGIRAGFSDFQKFAMAIGAPIYEPGKLSNPIELCDVKIRLGWTINNLRSETERK
jgi:uncharacterized protein DUF6946